jgi:uncharacterized membrane protein
MSLLSIAQWIQSTDFASALRISHYAYPIVMTAHLAGIALFGGMILMLDLRLLGLAMRRRSVSDVAGQLRVLKWAGLIIVAACGVLLACSKAEEYYYNPLFWIKMSLLALVGVHALVFRRSVYGNTAELDKAPQMPGRAKLAASLSLILWIGLVSAGRGIGYIEPPLERLHAKALSRQAERHQGFVGVDHHVLLPVFAQKRDRISVAGGRKLGLP